MSVALRSDPITFGDLQDALNDACTESESRTIQREQVLAAELEALRSDMRDLMQIITELSRTVDALAESAAA